MKKTNLLLPCISALFIVLFLTIVVSCFDNTKSENLTENVWALNQYYENGSLLNNTLYKDASIQFFKDGNFGGTSGFNSFMGNYTYNKKTKTLSINIIGMTKMLPPPEAEVFERLLIDLLQKTAKVAFKDSQTQLFDQNDTVLLTFVLKK